jgi:hypothetical protein
MYTHEPIMRESLVRLSTSLICVKVAHNSRTSVMLKLVLYVHVVML